MVTTGGSGEAVGERGHAVMCGTPAAEARARFHRIAHLLPITGLEEYLMVEAAMMTARAYARECAEAGPSGREPSTSPLTGGAMDDQRDWELALRRLAEALRV
jgi:hypothetical protein